MLCLIAHKANVNFKSRFSVEFVKNDDFDESFESDSWSSFTFSNITALLLTVLSRVSIHKLFKDQVSKLTSWVDAEEMSQRRIDLEDSFKILDS